MDPIKDYFTKKKSENPSFFENTSKELVLKDIEKELGVSIEDTGVLDVWYSDYNVFEKKKTISESASESMELNGSLDSKESKPRIEDYGDFDIEAHEEKVKARQRRDRQLLSKGQPSIREQMTQDIEAGRNDVKYWDKYKNSGFDFEEWDQKRIQKLKDNQGIVMSEEDIDEPTVYTVEDIVEKGKKPYQEKKQSGIVRLKNLADDIRTKNDQFLEDNELESIDSDFIQRPEKDVKIDLEKMLLSKGFTINTLDIGVNAIEIVSSNGKKLRVDLDILPSEKYGNRLTEYVAGHEGGGRSAKEFFDLESQALNLKNFIKENSLTRSYVYYDQFKENPSATVEKIYNDILAPGYNFYEFEDTKIDASDYNGLTQEIRSMNKRINDVRSRLRFKHPTDTSALPDRRELEVLAGQLKKLSDMKTKNVLDRSRYSKTISELMQVHGGVENIFDLTGDKGKQFMQAIQNMGVDPSDIRINTLKVEGVPVSLNEFQELITDHDTRLEVLKGNIDVEISNSEKLGVLNKYIDEAMALNERSKVGFATTAFKTLGATFGEIKGSVEKSINDFSSFLIKGANSIFSGDTEEEKQQFESALDEYISLKHKQTIDAAQKLRLGTPEISGGFMESESFGELMYKGGKAAIESSLYTATFLVAPEVGLALTGLSAYGRNMKELEDIRKYVQETGDPEGMYDNIDLTVGRARGLAASKALGETAITYFFTYNFLKNLGQSSTALRGLSIQEARKQINFYSKGAFSNFTNMMTKSLGNEIKEENIMSLTNMWIDEVYGLRKYNFSDYINTVKETSAAVPFTSIPLSAVGYKKLNRVSKKTVHNLIARAAWDADMHNMLDEFRNLERDILKSEENGTSVDDSIYQRRDELSEQIVKKNEQIVSDLEKTATKKQIVQLAKNQNIIAGKVNQISRTDIGDFSKKAAEEKINELVLENNRILTDINDSEFSKSLDELKEKSMSEIQDVITEEQKAEIEKYKNKDSERELTDREESARKLAASTYSYEQKFNPTEDYKEIEKIRELRYFLYNVTDSDINDFTRSVLVDAKKALSEGKGIDRVYNSIVRANNIVAEIVKENTSSDKIVPLKGIEAGFLGIKDGSAIKYNIATVNHAITMLLKNDRMAAPLRNLSGKIDAEMVRIQTEGRAALNYFYNMGFLEGKVSKKRMKQFQSEESDIERMFLAEMLKEEFGVDVEKNFLVKKKMMLDNLAKLREDLTQYGQRRADLWEATYNNLLASSSNSSEMIARASLDNVKAIDYLHKQFREIESDVLAHMENYYGRVPTRYTNYLPSFYSIQQEGEIKQSNDFSENLYGPSAMMETLSIDDLAQTSRMLIPDNWTKMTFRSMENAMAEYTLRPDLDALEGVIKSQSFEDMFDTNSRSIPSIAGLKGDFHKITGMFEQKISKLNSIIQSNGAVENDWKSIPEDLLNMFTKQVSARRLSTLSMRAAQGYSALLSVTPILSTRANRMMYENLIKFTSGGLGYSIKTNEGLQNVLSMSATQGRSGLEPLASGMHEKFYRRISANKGRKAIDKTIKIANQTSDFIMKKTLAESDKVAGQASFSALYYDRMLQKNPSKIKDMSFEQFWAWSSKPENVDMDAIAWADSQIDRSQMQAMPWNQGDLFNNRNVANILFPFGRFAYNRKAGMANDWAILNDDQVATEADKARALRRLASATVEIGVFKIIQPMFSIALTKSMIPLIAGLVGWDDEYDKIANKAIQTFNSLDPRRVIHQMNPFAISNYERNAAKEFKTALFEGMLPTPIPSIANEFVMMAINKGAKVTGYADDDIFNIYSKDIRDMFSGEAGGAISEDEMWAFALSNSGLLGMALEDIVKISGAFSAFDGRMSSNFGPQDPYIMKQAMPGAEVLGYVRLANAVVPLADMNRFANKLESLIQRKYTTTVPQNYDEE